VIMGRPAHKPNTHSRRQVEAMAGFGIPEADVARVLAIDPKTLRRHYRTELDTGHVRANARVAESLYRKATGEGREAVLAAIFWLKARGGWKEISVHETTGKVDVSFVARMPVPIASTTAWLEEHAPRTEPQER